MTEDEVVKATRGMPATVDSLRDDLSALGVTKGMVLLVHSSLSSMGWVCGGQMAVVLALEAALGPEGTLVMPTYSSDLSEPSYWKDPPVPEDWWVTIRRTMPAYDAKFTTTQRVGIIPECFRNQTGTRRSTHPSSSFAAHGKHSQAIVGNHPLNFPMGDDSPLARMYDLDGWILLLGVSFECASSLHLAEYRAKYPGKEASKQGAPIELGGSRTWIEFLDYESDGRDFEAIGEDFSKKTGAVHTGRVANATSHLFPQREFVDFAVNWIEKNRR